MNIFVLHSNPQIAAWWHCDVHVISQIKESAQIASSALYLNGLDVPGLYKPTHVYHPCVEWAASNAANFEWLYKLAFFLNCRFELHSKKQAQHGSFEVIETAYHALAAARPKNGTLSPWPQAMPRGYQLAVADERLDEHHPSVRAYRRYYAVEKRLLKDSRGKLQTATWTGCSKPAWFDAFTEDLGTTSIFEDTPIF